MWKTPQGIRILCGAEAALFRDGVAVLVDFIHEEASGHGLPMETAIPLFDHLSWTQRLVELDRVATALLIPSSPLIQPTAIHEAVVGAVFATVECMMQSECLFAEDEDWRRMVLDACRDSLIDESDELEGYPSASCEDLAEWSWTIDVLTDQILWDRDYEMAGDFLDAAPDQAAQARLMLGIDDEYFVAAAEDVEEQSAESLFQHLRKMTTSGTDDVDF